ncbi:MAG TPA: cysteine desulfurase [Vicinamibacterales bacterium]|jgi:cysteine desulfurase/selenocysteine lyase|nr:cysteine desulfurase [Vicinamibacterales bacterium]
MIPGTVPTATTTRFDVDKVRRDFPILAQLVHGKRLVYLDNANTSQKPRAVIEALDRYYEEANANIHRATHMLSERATGAYEGARLKAQQFVNAPEVRAIILTRGTTDGINLVAQSYGRLVLKPGDEVLISWMEHHSNIVPWQLVCEQTGARLRVAPIDDRGELVVEEFERLLSDRTRIVAVAHVSNSLGTINPVRQIVELAHAKGAAVLVDGAQAAPHLPIDVQALDCDFYVLSGHKMYGPTATGLLYGRTELLERMPPYQGGGDMIQSVTFEKTTYNVLPYKFEAGTPNIAGVVGFGAAIDYLQSFDRAAVLEHEDALLGAATARVAEIPGTRIYGTAREKTGVLSFTLDGIHPHDAGTILDAEGVAVRSGQHCAQPVMDRFGVPATIRASFGIYNTIEDVAALVAALHKARTMFA